MKAAIVLAMALCAATPAAAQSYSLSSVMGANAPIFVWRDDAALVEGMALVRVGAAQKNPGLVQGLIMCAVEPGTKAIGLDSPRRGVQMITVIDGRHAGCRGAVHWEELK